MQNDKVDYCACDRFTCQLNVAIAYLTRLFQLECKEVIRYFNVWLVV